MGLGDAYAVLRGGSGPSAYELLACAFKLLTRNRLTSSCATHIAAYRLVNGRTHLGVGYACLTYTGPS